MNDPATLSRDAGMAQAEAHADPRTIATIDAAIERAIASGHGFSANDIRDELPTTTSAGLVGARIRSYASRRPALMARVGYEPSTLASTHKHPVAIWVGVERQEEVA
jgi:hypothetical protein